MKLVNWHWPIDICLFYPLANPLLILIRYYKNFKLISDEMYCITYAITRAVYYIILTRSSIIGNSSLRISRSSCFHSRIKCRTLMMQFWNCHLKHRRNASHCTYIKVQYPGKYPNIKCKYQQKKNDRNTCILYGSFPINLCW